MTTKPWSRVVLGALALSLVAAACGGDDPEPSDGGDEITGSLNISGSSTVEPITSLVGEKFRPRILASTSRSSGPGTSDGFELFCNGETDISDASRPIDEEEVAACGENGIEPIELEIALDALSVDREPGQLDHVPELRRPLCAVRAGVERVLVELERRRTHSRRRSAGTVASRIDRSRSWRPVRNPAPTGRSSTWSAPTTSRRSAGSPRTSAGDLSPDYQISADDNVIIDNAAGTEGGLGFVGLRVRRERRRHRQGVRGRRRGGLRGTEPGDGDRRHATRSAGRSTST